MLIACFVGKRRGGYRQDNAGYPGHPLSREYPAWRGGEHSGAAWRLSGQRRLLSIGAVFHLLTPHDAVLYLHTFPEGGRR